MSVRHRLGKSDIAEGAMRGFDLGQSRHVVVANVGGKLFALDDMCNHAGCLLSGGKLAGAEVICPCHEMSFDVKTGLLLSNPRICDDQRRYELVVEGDELFVELTE